MASHRVLIVEDDAGSRAGLGELLRDEGYDVAETSGGADAVAVAREFTPHIAIVDVHLPDANGIELMREMSAFSPACACIVVSGSATLVTEGGVPRLEDLSQRAFTAGAVAYLPKPIDFDRLAHVLADCSRQIDADLTPIQA